MQAGNILITGASRGIVLGLAREFSRRDWEVFASRRTASAALKTAAVQSGGRIVIVQADVTDEQSIGALHDDLWGTTLDILVLNAGVYGPPDQSILALGRDDLADIMMSNAVGPARAAVRLMPLVRGGGTIAMMTSKMGSIDDSSGGANHYRLSKVAQNMLARSLFESHAKDRALRFCHCIPVG